MKLAEMKIRLQDKKVKKRIIVVAALIVCIIALAICMYFVGKSFEVHLSNMPYDNNGITLKGIDGIDVVFDKQDPIESYAGFSDTIQAVGLKHRLSVTHNGKEYVKTFKIPVSYRKVVISLPMFVESPDDVSAWMSELETQTVSQGSDTEVVTTDEFSIE